MVDSTPKPTAAVSTGICDASSCTSRKSSVPKVKNTRNSPRTNPKSPTRLTTNAFLPASEALFFV